MINLILRSWDPQVPLVIVGPPMSGRSVLARALAHTLGLALVGELWLLHKSYIENPCVLLLDDGSNWELSGAHAKRGEMAIRAIRKPTKVINVKHRLIIIHHTLPEDLNTSKCLVLDTTELVSGILNYKDPR